MIRLSRFAVLSVVLGVVAVQLCAQEPKKSAEPPSSPAHLKLTYEIAATTDQGLPIAFHIILKNTGDTAAYLPMPKFGCGGSDGSLQVEWRWRPRIPVHSPGSIHGLGSGCGGGYTVRPPVLDQVRNEWLRLLPGEFLTLTYNFHPSLSGLKPGIVDYQITYNPPYFTHDELLELQRGNYSVPMERLTTPQQGFLLE